MDGTDTCYHTGYIHSINTRYHTDYCTDDELAIRLDTQLGAQLRAIPGVVHDERSTP